MAILAIQELGETLETMAKAKVGEAIEEMRKENPALTSITSDNINIRYQQYGRRYKLDPTENMDKLHKDNLVKRTISYSPITTAIDEYREKYAQLPQGISESDRPKTLSFGRKKKKVELPL